MEQDKLPCAASAQERAQFERVWRKVMPQPNPDCPFTLYDDDAHRLMPGGGEVTGPTEDLPPAFSLGLAPMVPMVMDAENDVPCLGPASAKHGALLQSFIADELTDATTYRTMSRRTGGRTARILFELSEDERHHAKRLSAAYFLLAGVRFWPDKLPAPPMNTFMGSVRTRFMSEQKGERAYRAAAADTADPYLKELFLALAADEAAHVWLLKGLLEQM